MRIGVRCVNPRLASDRSNKQTPRGVPGHHRKLEAA